MAARTVEQVDAEMEALRLEKWALEHPVIEYPKHIQLGEFNIVVESAEQEKRLRDGQLVVKAVHAASEHGAGPGDTHVLVEAPDGIE